MSPQPLAQQEQANVYFLDGDAQADPATGMVSYAALLEWIALKGLPLPGEVAEAPAG